MSRPGINRFLAAVTVGLFALTTAYIGEADAGKKRRKRKAKAKATAVAKVNTEAAKELMGSYKFGMTKKEILGVLSKQIGAKYKEKISETTDVYAQDKLRRQRNRELNRIKKSYVEFQGKKTGWDVSIIDDQFAHNTDESMMVHWENSPDGADQRRFFFFQDGRLYKMFIALNLGKLKREQKNFAFFQGLMENRFGKGTVRTDKGIDGIEKPVAIEWVGKNHRVKAYDKLDFYGAFCLSVADPGTERLLAEVRKSAAKPKRGNAILDSVIADENDEEDLSLDANKAAVDSLLNK